MAKPETDIVNAIMKDVSPFGVRLFRNVKGLFYTKDSVKKLIACALSFNAAAIKSAIAELRQVSAGLLAPGASDLIGYRPVKITQEMVGATVAVFCTLEIKTPTGRVQPEQQHFVDFMHKNGGLAGIARSPEDARKILKLPA